MTHPIPIEDFLQRMDRDAVIDVRAPIEFARGHIPGAFNVPLFDDSEREQIGILFKDSGRDAAILHGLEMVGPKMRWIVEESRRHSGDRDILLHCWRGGMRSSSVAWLLRQTGMHCQVLQDGYKAFRRYAQRSFDSELRFIVLSGMTGAGKTTMLHALAELGEQIVDLESLAHHRGSSFGGIGLPPQPTCEHFENKLFLELDRLDPGRPVWIEDESPSIGKVRVPDSLWWGMRRSPAIFLDIDRQRRSQNLRDEYGALDETLLREATQRLEKKLGGLRTKQIVEHLESQNFERVAFELLEYYDKTYQHATEKRPRKEIHRLRGSDASPRQVLELSRKLTSTTV